MKHLFVPLTALAILARTASHADIIYVAEEQLTRVSIVQPDGTPVPFATGIWLLYGLTVDAAGDVYAAAAGDDVIRKITPAGAVSVVASGTILGSPDGMVLDEAGNLYSTGFGWSGTINRISPDGTVTRLITGVGGMDLARDATGNLYVSSRDKVVKFATNGVAATFASGFQMTWGLAFDQDGILFVADNVANTISKVTPSGSVSLFASGMDRPTGLAFDSDGNLYVCNITENQPLGHLAQVTPDGRVSLFPPALKYPTAIAIYKEPGGVLTNHPPVARCTNVVVSAGPLGNADASINNGSFDPDGGPMAFAQTPPGPYPLGTTEVTLTVIDSQGASDSCQATVTVVDTTPPEILSAAATPSVLWPPNHKMVPVSLTARVTDNSGLATWRIIRVRDNESANRPGKGDPSPDWVITGDHTLQLRAERPDGRADRVYSITIQATDASGNDSAPEDVTVTVPANQGRDK